MKHFVAVGVTFGVVINYKYGTIGLTRSSQGVITSMVNFPFLLIFNFKYILFFFNIFNTEVMAVLAKISMTIFLEFRCHTFISAFFYQSIGDKIVSYCFLIFLIK